MDPLISMVMALCSSRLDPASREEIFEKLYRAIQTELRLYIFRRVKPSDVEDVLQETWRGIVAGLNSFRGDTDKQFLKWCYIIAMRRCADSHSHRDPAENWPDDELTNLVDKSEMAKEMSPQDRLDVEFAKELFAKSKPKCRELLWKHYIDDLDISDIAEELNLKYDAIRMSIKRCLNDAQGLI